MSWFMEEPHLKYPPSSPDLSPIEPIWSLAENRLTRGEYKWGTQKEFEAAVQRAFEEVTSDRRIVDNLYASMPKRIKTLIEREGGYTGY